MRACEIPNCEGAYYARGYCQKHYQRNRKFGHPLRTKGTPHGLTVMERFMRHVRVEPSGCWIWIGATYGGPAHRESHGSWRPDQQKSPVGAHVWIYEQTVGPVPEGMHLDHFKCDRPLCVNPEHVRPATPRENTLRGNSFAAWNAAKTHCIHGHEFTPENTYLHKGSRLCRACRARSWRASGGRKSRARATN